MNCNSGQRKVFADDVVENISQLAKKYGLEDLVVQRTGDPVLVAARGCLKGENDEHGGEKIEIVVHISPNLRGAEARGLNGSEIVSDVPTDVSKAFDLSQVVAKDSVADSSPAQDTEKEC